MARFKLVQLCADARLASVPWIVVAAPRWEGCASTNPDEVSGAVVCAVAWW